jgi:hypothetical protein
MFAYRVGVFATGFLTIIASARKMIPIKLRVVWNIFRKLKAFYIESLITDKINRIFQYNPQV